MEKNATIKQLLSLSDLSACATVVIDLAKHGFQGRRVKFPRPSILRSSDEIA